MEERKKKGLCYSCDEKWGLGHKCKSAKLFLLGGIEFVPDLQSRVKITEWEEEVGSSINEGQNTSTNSKEVEITLYALIGTPTPVTMKIKGRINDVSLVVLLETGSTHNFVDAALVFSSHLMVNQSQTLEVKVANGEDSRVLWSSTNMHSGGGIFHSISCSATWGLWYCIGNSVAYHTWWYSMEFSVFDYGILS